MPGTFRALLKRDNPSGASLDKVVAETISEHRYRRIAAAVGGADIFHAEFLKPFDDGGDLSFAGVHQVKSSHQKQDRFLTQRDGTLGDMHHARMGTPGDDHQPSLCFDDE